MTGEHGDEETSNHHEGPYRAGDEGLLLLLIFRLDRFLNVIRLSECSSPIHIELKLTSSCIVDG
jgi:hypothetical protein